MRARSGDALDHVKAAIGPMGMSMIVGVAVVLIVIALLALRDSRAACDARRSGCGAEA
jgi:uncharacterized membrane protein